MLLSLFAEARIICEDMKCTTCAGGCLIECGASARLMTQAGIVLLCATAISHAGTVQLQLVTVPLK